MAAPEADDAAMLSGSDDSDDSRSDDSGGGGGPGGGGGASDADLAAVMALEQSLRTHPDDYALRVQHVALLRRCGLRGRLREAREELAARFPLAEPLWREWLEDELEAAARCAPRVLRVCARVQAHRSSSRALTLVRRFGRSAEDVDALEALHERALRDALSVPLWVAYIEARGRRGACAAAVRALTLPTCAPLCAQFLRGSGAPADKLRAAYERALAAGGLHFWQARRVSLSQNGRGVC